MGSMFSSCSSLTSLNVSGFNTAKVTKMGSMFSGCRSLTSLNVSSFNTEQVTDMDYMFQDVPIEGTLDISNFSIDSLIEKINMFYYCGASTVLVKSDAIRSEFMNGTGKPSGMTITVK